LDFCFVDVAGGGKTIWFCGPTGIKCGEKEVEVVEIGNG